MENLSFVKNGVLRLPPGFRFHPTDEELIVQYLKRKAFSFPLPAAVIPEVDVFRLDPWDLPGDLERERYFFSTREAKYCNGGGRSNRATASGYWRASGLERRIVSSKENQLVGLKKTFVFYTGKPLTGLRTGWVMHEYRLVASQPPQPAINGGKPTSNCVQNWVLCRIYSKKISTRERDEVKNTSYNPVFHEFLRTNHADLNLAPSSPSSGSSGVTEVTLNDHDHHHQKEEEEEEEEEEEISSSRRR